MEDWMPEETYAGDPGTYWSGVGGTTMETEDEWADRMWREMQEKRRQQAAAESRTFASAAAAARAREQQAATNAFRAVESERILQREKAKDAEWRRKASSGELFVEAARASLGPLEPAVAHAAYKASWERLMERLRTCPTGKPLQLGVQDVAWPLPEGHAYTKDALGDVLLHGVQGPADIKARLREELMRWHPDKFSARLGYHLDAAAAPAITQRVKEVSQALTALMTGNAPSARS
ncbi:hypothetical protein DUNSADRAFT_10872 [Dunaliella salina]|nr:hypothetical protein DUNSADRAFT_10872 [Dunaliella salina]|eukprot:KAF5843696.1 hypothetical protein DUNSADRAFT_10872 [Dunaliella salina]